MTSLTLAAALAVLPARSQAAVTIRIGMTDARGKVVSIKKLDMEEYLLGVLPNEMDSTWPLEALKAQAVVARTFAYAHLGRFEKKGFDLTSDSRSQMYGGKAQVAESVRRAVEETKGEVMGYAGQLLTVYYHSSCGGRTVDPVHVWGGAPTPKPLRGVRDPYCKDSPYARWTAYFTDVEILAALQGTLLTSTVLRSFRIGDRDRAGNVVSFIADMAGDVVKARANDLRNRLGASQLKSLKLRKAVRLKRGVEFVGAGSGHGVGLCQWGARGQAVRGRRYETILRFYFPGSTLSVVTE